MQNCPHLYKHLRIDPLITSIIWRSATFSHGSQRGLQNSPRPNQFWRSIWSSFELSTNQTHWHISQNLGGNEDEQIKAKVCDKNIFIDQQFFCDFPMFPIVVRWIHLQLLKKVLHKLSITLLYWAHLSIMKNEMWLRWRNHAPSKFFLCYMSWKRNIDLLQIHLICQKMFKHWFYKFINHLIMCDQFPLKVLLHYNSLF